MSKEIAKRKKGDIERIEAELKEMEEKVREDRCPSCGTLTIDFVYINAALMKEFGWLECPNCGIVFCPESLRKMKVEKLRTGSTLVKL